MSQTAATRVTDLVLPPAGTWELDPSHTAATFSARHLMVTKVRGRFRKLSGTIHVGDAPETSRVEVSIDAASIDTDTQMRDDHLRSPDFLDVERFPTITFASTRVEQTGDDELRVTGNLTIRDVTRPVTLDVEYNGLVDSPMGDQRTGFSATTEIDREDFGMTWNQALESGGLLVGRKVKIELDVEAILQQ